MSIRLKILLSILATANTIFCFAQGADPINVVTSAVPFLRISPDARAGAMGDLGIATAPDANNMFWNLAKTPFHTSRGGVALTYTPWLKDIGVNDVFLASLAGFYKIDDQSAFSASLRYFSLGNIQFTDFSGNPLSTGKPTELGVDVGYSRKLTDKWAIGAALRYVNSNLARGYASSSGVDYKAGTTVAGDLSVYYDGTDETGKGFRFGAAFSNLGGKISYTNNATERDYIPANLGIGFTYTTIFDENSKLSMGIDANKLLVPTPPIATGDSAIDANALLNYRNKGVVNSWFSSFGDAPNEFKEVQFSAGAEFAYQEQFFVRAGYFYEDKTKGNRKYASAGFGLKFNVFKIDFSYLIPSGSGATRNPLSNTLRFTLSLDLDNLEE